MKYTHTTLDWPKHKSLPEYKVLTIWYLSINGEIEDSSIERIKEFNMNYNIGNIIQAGNGKYSRKWVDYMCQKRNEPLLYKDEFLPKLF